MVEKATEKAGTGGPKAREEDGSRGLVLQSWWLRKHWWGGLPSCLPSMRRTHVLNNGVAQDSAEHGEGDADEGGARLIQRRRRKAAVTTEFPGEAPKCSLKSGPQRRRACGHHLHELWKMGKQ